MLRLIETTSLEHWKGAKMSTKATKKQMKHAIHVVVRPLRACKKKKVEKIQGEEDSRDQHGGDPHAKVISTALSTNKSKEIKDKVLHERIERMQKKRELEEEQWKSRSQWRWEVITGRARMNIEETGAVV